MNKLLLLLSLIFPPSYALSQNNVLILKHSTTININKQHLHKKESYEILFNNNLSEEHCSVKIPYLPMIKVSNISASIVSPNGKLIKKLNKSDISSKSLTNNYSFYTDNMLKEFTLKHDAYPYILKYSYETDESEFMLIDCWKPYFDYKIPVANAELDVSVPSDYPIKYISRFVPEPETDTTSNTVSYHWKMYNTQPAYNEEFSPNIDDLQSSVTIFPVNFHYGNPGSFDSWASFGNWQYKTNKERQTLDEAEIKRIGQITNGITDSIQLLKTLYHDLQDNMRYVNISIKTGRYVTYPAQYVVENRFGDCKALSNYFQSVLNLYGFRSHYSLVNASDDIPWINEAISCPQFNHIILCVPVQRDTIWLDCTSKGPFGYLGTFTQGRKALIVEKNKSRLVGTPALTPGQVLNQRSIRFENLSENTCKAIVSKTLRGDNFEFLAHIHSDLSTKKMEYYVRKKMVEPDFEPDSIKVHAINRDSLSIGLSYVAATNNLLYKYGGNRVLKPIRITVPKLENPSYRHSDLQINYPIYQTDEQFFGLGNEFKTGKIPAPQSVDCQFGSYQTSWQQVPGGIIFKQLLLLKATHIPIDKSMALYRELYDFIEKIHEIENQNNILLTNNN